MPQLLAIGLTYAGVSGTIAGVEIATIAANAIFAAATVGAGLVLTPDLPTPDAPKVSMKQSIPPRVGLLGQDRVAGAYMLYHAKGQWSYDVLALKHGEATSIEGIYLHEDLVTLESGSIVLDGDGRVIEGTVEKLADGRYKRSNIQLFFRYGDNPQDPFDYLVTRLSPDDLWTNDHRGDGIVAAAMVCKAPNIEAFSEMYPFGLPQLSLVLRGDVIFDPRDTSQVWDDTSTHVWSDNPILLAMHFIGLSTADGGMGYDFAESFLPILDEIGAAADVCDGLVNRHGGGTQKRYTGGGSWQFSNTPDDVLAGILAACDGWACERGDGTIPLDAGLFDAAKADIIITDKHIIQLRTQYYREDENATDAVIVTYKSPAHDYTMIDAPSWPRDIYSVPQNRIRSASIPWCQDGHQAQRLSKRIHHYTNAEVTGSMVLTLFGITLMDRRWARIQSIDSLALADAYVRIDSVEFDAQNHVVIVAFTKIDPAVLDAWDAATEGTELQPVVSVPLDDEPESPNVTAIVAERIGEAINVDITLTTPDDGEDFSYAVEYRIADVGGGSPGGWTPRNIPNSAVVNSGGDTTVTVLDVASGVFDFRIQSIDTKNRRSEFSTPEEVDTRAPAPGSPTDLAVALDPTQPRISWVMPDSDNVHHARVFRAITTAGFGAATDVSGEIAGGPLDPRSFLDSGATAGTYDYWVTAEDITDQASSPTGPETITVI